MRVSKRARASRRASYAALVLLALGACAFGMRELVLLQRERTNLEARRRDADSMLVFMLDDLHTSLRAIGKLGLLERVLRESLRHAERWSGEGDSDIALRRATSKVYLGQVEFERRACTRAVPLFEGAIRECDRRDPHDRSSAWQPIRSQAMLGLADCELVSNQDYAAALIRYRELLQLVSRRVPADRYEHRMDRVRALLGVGDTLQRTNGARDAFATFTEARDVLSEIAASRADDEARFLGSVADNKIGEVLLRLGDPAGAAEAFRRSRDARELQVAAEPQDLPRRRNLLFSVLRLGMAQQALGDLAAAGESFDRCIELARDLAARDSQNVTWRRDLSGCLLRRSGVVTSLEGDAFAQAVAQARESAAIRREILARNPSDRGALFDEAEALENLARLLSLDARSAGEASIVLRAAADITTGLVRDDGSNQAWRDLDGRIRAAAAR